MNMDITSRRSILSILAGVSVGLLVSTFLKSVCWGPLIGVFLAAYLAKVPTPKEGAKIGAVVLVPFQMVYAALHYPAESIAKDTAGKLGNLLGVLLAVAFMAAVGALYGFIIGKLFQLAKDKGILL